MEKTSSFFESQTLSEADYLSLFTWPPRSYTCTYCKREFKSAQALGGHMNVHRRDRARLRQIPPQYHHQTHRLNLNLDPNPSFSPSSSAAAAKAVPPTISTASPATVSDHFQKWGRADRAKDLMEKTKELAARRFFKVVEDSRSPSFSPSSSAAAAKVVPPSVSTISTTAPATVSDHFSKWGKADFAKDLMVKTKDLAARRFVEVVEDSGDEVVEMELDLELRLGYV